MRNNKTDKRRYLPKNLSLTVVIGTILILSTTAIIITTPNAQANSSLVNVKFKGVVIGEPNISGVGVGSANVLLYDIISVDPLAPGPLVNFTVGEVITVTWPISGKFAGTTTYFLETVEVNGGFMDEPMPESWSEVGKAWVELSDEDHYLNEIKFEELPIWEWGAIILAIIAIIIAAAALMRKK
ncbi:MAG: hypothetical protein H3Z50_06915 [archaeon]|nr:hypothetical protein [archaeon]MCP8306322.1 hypothetical protein [archaeon]